MANCDGNCKACPMDVPGGCVDIGEERSENKPYWQCQECGYTDRNKPIPADRTKFYARKESPKCPKCHSIGFVPIGF